MANIDAPFGFRQVGGLGSRQTSEGTSKYVIASGYTSAIYAGDVVEFGAGLMNLEQQLLPDMSVKQQLQVQRVM